MAKKVLIVDDAAFMRMMIKDILTKNGYEIAAEAENGKVAVDKYKETSPDLTLLDINQYRINLIHKDGTVYFDSQVKDNLENHANREEFVQAQHFGQSKVYRYSETLGKRTFYFAVRLVGDNILRCAYTTDNIISQAGSLAIHIFGILIVAVIMASILAFKISKSIVAPINEIDLNNVYYEEEE